MYSMSTSAKIKLSGDLNLTTPINYHHVVWGKFSNEFERIDAANPLLRFQVYNTVYELQWFTFYESWLRSRGMTKTTDIEAAHRDERWIIAFQRVQHMTKWKFKNEDKATAINILSRGIDPYVGNLPVCNNRGGNGVKMTSRELKGWCQTMYANYNQHFDNFYMRLFAGIGVN